jgi:hypothetical protein
MAKSIENIDELIYNLELDPPDAYAKCVISIPDKKGKLREQKYILNLSTGDVFKNRKLTEAEESNYRVIRQYQVQGQSEISYYAFRNAQIIDEKIVLATWVFGDYINQPGTSQLVTYYYGPTDINDAKRGSVINQEALLNIVLAKPKVATVVTIDKNKEVAAWEDLDRYGINGWHNNGRSAYLSENLLGTLNNAYETKRVYGMVSCFKELFKVGYAGANRYLTFDSHQDVSVFMKSKPMQARNNAHQKQVDELTAIPIPDHSIVPMTENTICYADRVNAEWTVLRWWARSKAAYYVETSRMYVNKTDSIHCRSDLNGGWIYAGAKIKPVTFNADRVILQYPCVLDDTKLEYFKNISADMSIQSAALYMLTMYPEFEKMYKIGLDWLCDNYIQSPYQTSWKNYLKEHVGYIDWEAKNIFKMVGVNRYQIEAINTFVKANIIKCNNSNYGYWQKRNVLTMIEKMKRIFNVDSLNSIDNESFDYILNSITLNRLMSVYVQGLALTFKLFGKDAMYFIKDLNTIAEDSDYTVEIVSRYGYRTQMNIDRMYYDTLSMIESGEYMDVLRPRFSTVEELMSHHNIMVDLINANKLEHEARQNKQYESGFDANHKRWEKWEWDGDQSDFCVIAPTKPIDVAAEGITLRHCVKSYIPSVSNGSTNIMFIRLKGKESEPFFTVEVDRTNSIRQVHGMCNCNASSVEGLTEFLKKWSKLKKLRYSESSANAARAVGY